MEANSGLYEYRTKQEIDSIYNWAYSELKNIETFGGFYNIIIKLTDFEGSLHNDTYFPQETIDEILKERSFFPYPSTLVDEKLIVDVKDFIIPFASEILEINDKEVEDIISNIGMYYHTDGYNETGRRDGINSNFSLYYRFKYGKSAYYKIKYLTHGSKQEKITFVRAINIRKYRERQKSRHLNTLKRKFKETDYVFKGIDGSTALLRINTFSFDGNEGNEKAKFKSFMDTIFLKMENDNTQNLIVDLRANGGGNDPNDMVTVSFLSDKNKREVDRAWVSFTKNVPYWKYVVLDIPFYLKPIAKIKLRNRMKIELPIIKNGRRYYDNEKVYEPEENRFQGNIYLLVGPSVASAASLSASLISNNDNVTVIGEETSGGYYMHNGVFPIEYKLPKTEIKTKFSIVNLTQDVDKDESQPIGRGLMPDIEVKQSIEDYVNGIDTVLEFTKALISQNHD
jgi:hypothetical protein